jgi:hypothetical protein
MIPLRDTIPSSTVPVVNLSLIAINVGCFIFVVSLGGSASVFVERYGFVPARLVFGLSHHAALGTLAAPIFSSMFLHGGLLHLLGNMLYLHIFGDNVEDRLGHLRYLGLYLASGVVAALVQLAADPASRIPMIGASGAIAGITGAYLTFFPTARIVTLVPIFFFVTTVRIPAFLVLIPWFLLQIQGGLISASGRHGVGGIAFWAHVGGFVAGFVVGQLLAGRPRKHVERY